MRLTALVFVLTACGVAPEPRTSITPEVILPAELAEPWLAAAELWQGAVGERYVPDVSEECPLVSAANVAAGFSGPGACLQ